MTEIFKQYKSLRLVYEKIAIYKSLEPHILLEMERLFTVLFSF